MFKLIYITYEGCLVNILFTGKMNLIIVSEKSPSGPHTAGEIVINSAFWGFCCTFVPVSGVAIFGIFL